MDISDFPFLNHEEFTEACHFLDSTYRQATLGPLRRRWKLNMCSALSTTFSIDGSGYNNYIQIIKPLEEGSDLPLDLGGFSLSDNVKEDSGISADTRMMETEDSDMHTIQKQNPRPDVGYVTYEIHLHPTYRLPCLWFTLHNLPADETAFNIDTVFRRLVPDEYKATLREGIGGIGGISADHHPVTGLPCFFIHPCLVGEAMSGFSCSRQNYLMVWLGVVGSCVGLWVPKEMAIER